jgi:hypothetical protein
MTTEDNERKWVCQNCNEESKRSLQRGMCSACYRWWFRHGTMRPEAKKRRVSPGGNKRTCKHCKEAQARIRGMCKACYDYWLRTNKRRPKHLSKDACVNCGKPKTKPRDLAKGRCKNCYYWWHKYGVDRTVGNVRWCDCGNVATHLDVELQLLTVSNQLPTFERYDFCDSCYQLEFGE